MKLKHWLHDLLSSRRFNSNRAVRRSRLKWSHSPYIEPLEDRVMLSVTSVADTGIAFSVDNEDLFENQANLSQDFDISFIDESFGYSIGGFSAGTGIKLSIAGAAELGIAGSIDISGGTVDFDYLTDVSVTTAGINGSNPANLAAGDHFTINTSEVADQSGIALVSKFGAIDFDLGFNFGLEASLGIKAKILGKTVLSQGISFGQPAQTFTVIAGSADTQTAKVDFTLFNDVIIDDSTIADSPFKAFVSEVDRGFEVSGESLLAGFYVPELDTGVVNDSFDDSKWDGQTIVNSHFPIDTTKIISRIDFVQIGFDAIEFLIEKGSEATIGVPIPTSLPAIELGSFVSLDDTNFIAGVFAAKFSVAQELTFDPALMVDLNFMDASGAPMSVSVATFVGSGVFETLTTKRIDVGKSVEIVHPGGELNIDTDYVLGGSFQNKTTLYVRPTFDFNFLSGGIRVKVDGLPKFEKTFSVLQKSFPLADPAPLVNLTNSTVTIDSFAEVDGSDLSLTASTPTDFSVVASVDRLTPFEGGEVTADISFFDPAGASDGSDIYELTVDWKDGNVEVLTLDNSNSLPSNVFYNATSRQLTVSYSDRGTLDSHDFFVDRRGLASSLFKLPTFGALNVGDVFIPTDNTSSRLTITSVDATTGEASWGLDLRNEIIPASVLEKNFLTISTTFSPDPRLATADREADHEVVVNWGDPNDPRESTFTLGGPRTWSVGQKFSSSTDDNILTITQVDLVVDGPSNGPDEDDRFEVSFDVSRRYLDDGDSALGNGTPADPVDIKLVIQTDFGRLGEIEGSTTVTNVAPTIVLDPQDDPVGEGGVMLLSGHFIDPGTQDTFELVVDWGDGSSNTYSFGTTTTNHQFNNLGHVYAANGNYTIVAAVTDDDTGVGTASLPIVVDFVSLPQAEDDFVTTTEDNSIVINVLADNGNGPDSDPDGDLVPAKTIQVGTFAGGVLTGLGNGSFKYDPNGEFDYLGVGEETQVQFFYRIEDATEQWAFGTVTITVTGVNDGPSVFVDQPTAQVDEGETATNSGTFADVDASDTVTISASVGTITQGLGGLGNSGVWTWSFDTADGRVQSQIVVITAADKNGGKTTASFGLTVNNVAPTANDASFDVVENSANDTVIGSVTASDPGADTLAFSITGGTGLTAFDIDSGSGEITVLDSAQLDFETTTFFTLEVTVTDD